jgi:hypothetical protein
VQADCVDYLVGNEYTAYWLHLAALGNARTSPRTADDNTFLSQPAMARWLVPEGPALCHRRPSHRPAEVRRDVDVIHQTGHAAVIARRSGGWRP